RRWPVRPRSLLVLALVLVACGVAHTQAPPAPIPAPTYTYQVVRTPAIAAPQVPTPVPPTPEPTFEQLLTRLEGIHDQKGQRERMEKDLLKTNRDKRAPQAERLKKLGVTPPPPAPTQPVIPQFDAASPSATR